MSGSPQSFFARFRNELGLVIAIFAVLSITSMINQDYFREPWRNFRDIAQETSLVGIFALGAAIVIIAGGIDLSSGTMILFSASVCVLVTYIFAPISGGRPNPAQASDFVVWCGVGAALVTGLLVGTFHAWLITIVKLPPFVATLATLVGLRSLTKIMNGGITDSLGIKVQSINASASLFGNLRVWWIPVVVFLALGTGLWLLMNRTVIGRHLYALGGNEEAARLSGINTDNLKWLAYTIGSVTASIAGVLYAAKISTCTPSSMGVGYELNAIAAAVVGGCSLQGGTGLIPGVMLGVLFLQVVIDAVAKVFKTNPDDWKGQIVGLLVVLAVAFNEIRRGGTGGRKRMFPGAIGWVTVPMLALVLTLEVFAADAQHRLGAALAVGGVALAALLARKLFEDFAGAGTAARAE
jgi:ribose/xylose/arabinose/galactoside ABC-type transport system permease subunit